MKYRYAAPAIALLILLSAPCLTSAQTSTKNSQVEKEFLVWASKNLHPVKSIAFDAPLAELQPLDSMIGNATYVSFGEGLHMAAEPLEFRNLLFRYLVEKKGFTAIAIESGIVEGFEVNQYVLGGPGDLNTVVKNGFTFGFNVLPQEADLVRWMRAYNADPRHTRKVQFYGTDLSMPSAGSNGPLNQALGYLDRIDPGSATALRNRIGDLLPKMNFSRFSDSSKSYIHLSQAERDRLTAAIADMITLFQIHEAAYIRASSDSAYRIAYRTAIAARQADEYERQVPLGWTPKTGMGAILDTGAISDRAKADNLRWIKQQLGPGAKILNFAHRDHIATTLETLNAPPQNPQHLPPTLLLPPMMGTYMKRSYGTQLVTIGNFLSKDISRCKANRPPAPAGSLEALLSEADGPFFLLDLRNAPPKISAWLNQPHELYGLDLPDTLNVKKGFDVIFFSRVVTPAVPCR